MAHATTMANEGTAQDTFGRLLEQHRRSLFKVVNTYAFTPHEREELAQEIATQLWRAYPGYDPARPFATWMYRIALNVAISQVRSVSQRGRHAVPFDEQLHDLPDPQPVDPETEQQVRALHRFIAGLDKLNRALLVLYLEDHSHRQIAEILGISETNVATKIGRLKQRIAKEL